MIWVSPQFLFCHLPTLTSCSNFLTLDRCTSPLLELVLTFERCGDGDALQWQRMWWQWQSVNKDYRLDPDSDPGLVWLILVARLQRLCPNIGFICPLLLFGICSWKEHLKEHLQLICNQLHHRYRHDQSPLWACRGALFHIPPRSWCWCQQSRKFWQLICNQASPPLICHITPQQSADTHQHKGIDIILWAI